MRKIPFDYTLIVAQLPSQSPSEIDAALKVLADFCAINGTQLPAGLEEQILNNSNPSVLVSLARYCSSIEIFNTLWDRATTAPIATDNDFLRKGLRRACASNRLAPLSALASSNYPEGVWCQEKLKWLTDYEPENTSGTERDYERWWDTIILLQNESVPIKILADAIARNGVFSNLDQGEHEALLRHISSNPILANRKGRHFEGWGDLRDAVRNLLDARTLRPEFRAAVYDLLLSLAPDFRGEFCVSPVVLQQCQFSKMPEILANAGKTYGVLHNHADLMPLVAFASWPVNLPVNSTPHFFTYAAKYVIEDMTLRQMLDGITRDGNLFCLLAMWNMHIMRSDTKRAMLQQMIAGHVPMAKPILEDDLREIYNKRISIFEQNYQSIRGKAWAFMTIPAISKIKWRARLRGAFGLSNKKEYIMLDIARANEVFQNGGPLKAILKGAKEILGLVAICFTIFIAFDAFLLEGKELKVLMHGLKTLISTLP